MAATQPHADLRAALSDDFDPSTWSQWEHARPWDEPGLDYYLSPSPFHQPKSPKSPRSAQQQTRIFDPSRSAWPMSTSQTAPIKSPDTKVFTDWPADSTSASMRPTQMNLDVQSPASQCSARLHQVSDLDAVTPLEQPYTFPCTREACAFDIEDCLNCPCAPGDISSLVQSPAHADGTARPPCLEAFDAAAAAAALGDSSSTNEGTLPNTPTGLLAQQPLPVAASVPGPVSVSSPAAVTVTDQKHQQSLNTADATFTDNMMVTSAAAVAAAALTSSKLKSDRKRAHSAVERKYRGNLNQKIEALRQALSDAQTANLQSAAGKLGEDVTAKLAANVGSKKADVLTNAIWYVQDSEQSRSHLMQEVAFLRSRVTTLEKMVKCEDCPILKQMADLRVSMSAAGGQ